MASRKQTILIVGGGGGGVHVASTLSQSLDASKFNIQLVTERSFHIHWPGMLRAITTSVGNFDEKAFMPYDKLFAPGKPGELIVGKVTSIEDGVAHLGDGRALPYDYLVLATGTVWEGPLALPLERERVREWVNEWHAKLSNANGIVVVGGGAVGIEICGEIRHFIPDKEVTLVHNQDQLLNSAYPAKYRKTLFDGLKAIGVTVYLKDRVTAPMGPHTSITTENGVKIKADVVIAARGGKANTAFLETFDSSILTSKGSVKVLKSLQVPLRNGKTNVFAIGDIIDWPEQKTLSKLPTQAAAVTANILSAVKGSPGKQEYKGFLEAIVVPLGPNGGRGYIPLLWGIQIGDFLTKTLKGRKLFIPEGLKSVTAPVPSFLASIVESVKVLRSFLPF
ncbi:hypothetical protein FRB96_000343 [Tulasnella sp. 330]|nr:hypothetical protein FRB96_000343 [Tulasnella sp. 330]KAG8885027.1 hypothetical protein FRB97_002534 [Tulasnella sp. 331]KAG8890899.1 hypothetical protein FRB98_002919 [Tulasnella sp. 332]